MRYVGFFTISNPYGGRDRLRLEFPTIEKAMDAISDYRNSHPVDCVYGELRDRLTGRVISIG